MCQLHSLLITKTDLLILSSGANPSRLVIIQTNNVLRTLVLARSPNTQSGSWKVNRNHTTVESYTVVMLGQESGLSTLKIDGCFSERPRDSTTPDRTHYLLIFSAFFLEGTCKKNKT